MWKAIQGDEKAGFIKDYQDGKYKSENITAVNFMSTNPIAQRISGLVVQTFISDDIVILVKVD